MSGFLFGAIVCFIVSACCVVGWLNRGRRHKRLYLTESVTPGDLTALHAAAREAAGPDTFAQIVDVAGAAAPGPGGLLVSELGRQQCVWHRNRVVRRFEEDIVEDGKQKRVVREETVSELRTETPFLVQDSTGAVTVLPSLDLEGATKVVDEFDDQSRDGGDGRTLGYSRQEWVITAGTPLFVHGEAADRGGELVVRDPKGGAKADRLTITTRSEEEVLSGLKKSGTAFLASAIGFDLLGVVLLVIGVAG